MKANENHVFGEAVKVVKLANDYGIILRLFGGLAVRIHCHGPHSEHLRTYHDLDFLGLEKESERIHSVFQKLGYSPNVKYNTLYGATRLQFVNQRGQEVDVFLDKIRMDHVLDFRDRLHLDDLTIPITDLLLTKLQIVKLTAKDAKDLVAILEDHRTGFSDDRELLNINYVADICSRDWGLYKSVTDSLSKMHRFIEQGIVNVEDKKELEGKLENIRVAIATKRKRLRWMLRSILGEKVKWYNEVEIGEGEFVELERS